MDFKAGLYDGVGDGITGSTDLKIKIKRDADDYFYDFNDSTFKASGWTTIAATMTEIDATNVPGEYEKAVDVSAWNDGVYTVYYQYSGSAITPFTDAVEFQVYNGAEVISGLHALLDRTLGLSQENQYIDTTVYDGNNNMTSCRLRIYSAAGSVGTDSDVIATYTVTCTYTANNLTTFKVVKQ